MLILSGTANPFISMSLMMETTDLRALPSMLCSPSSGMIFQPFLEPNDFLMLKDTSCPCCLLTDSGHGLEHLEFAAEFVLDEDFSLAFLKLRALLSSLLKLLTLVRVGLALRGLSSGELGGMGDLARQGEAGLECLEGWNSWRSKGLGDLDTAGVERGESSLISQYSSLMSGVDCLLLGQEFSSLFSILCRVFLGGVARGGVRRSRLGGVRLSLVLRPPSTDLLTPGPNSAVTGFFSC